MIRYMCCDSPIGKLVVCEESDRLVAIRLNEIPIGAVPEETSVGKEACSQLVDYFRGQRKDFQLPLACLAGIAGYPLWRNPDLCPSGGGCRLS